MPKSGVMEVLGLAHNVSYLVLGIPQMEGNVSQLMMDTPTNEQIVSRHHCTMMPYFQ